MGHLDREEAERYWNQNILTQWLKNDAPPMFEKAFEVCGGSTYLVPFNGPIHRDASNFHVVLQEDRRLMNALKLHLVTSFEEYYEIMRKLTKTNTGTLD